MILSLLFAIAQSTFYVAPSGVDAGPGSFSSPWATPQYAIGQARPGDTVYLRAGQYVGAVEFRASGTAGAPITLAAYPGEERQAVISRGGIRAIGKSHLIVDGLKVQQSPDTGVWIEGPGVSDVTIRGCWFYDTVSSAIAIWGVNWGKNPGTYDNIREVLIEGNLIERATNGGYNETITVANGVRSIIVRRNILRLGRGLAGRGLGDEGIDFKEGVEDGWIVENELTDLDHNAIYLDAGRGHGNWPNAPRPFLREIHVARNWVHDSDAHGVSIAAEGKGIADGIYVYNNVVSRMENFGFLLYDHPEGRSAGSVTRNVYFVNNTAYGNGTGQYGGGFRVDHGRAENVAVINCIAWGNRGAGFNGPARYRHCLGPEATSAVREDPRFVAPASTLVEGLKVRAFSPAIRAGLNFMPHISTDYSGASRPARGVGPFTIGAFE